MTDTHDLRVSARTAQLLASDGDGEDGPPWRFSGVAVAAGDILEYAKHKAYYTARLLYSRMSKPVYEEIAPEVEEMFWDHTVSEICDELDVSPNTYYRAKEHAGLPEKSQTNRLEYQYGVPADWLFDTLHNTLGKSVAQMAEELDVAHQWICDTMDDLGVSRRGHSESQKVRWAQLSEEEQQARMEAPLKARRLQPAYFETDHRGYERWRTTIDGERLSVAVHRLLAVAEHGFDAVVDNHIHHGPVEIPWANWHDNVRPMDPEEHLSHHKSDESTND